MGQHRGANGTRLKYIILVTTQLTNIIIYIQFPQKYRNINYKYKWLKLPFNLHSILSLSPNYRGEKGSIILPNSVALRFISDVFVQ